MEIRIRETGQVMYEGEFRTLFPNTSLPQQLSEAIINELGADVVFEGPLPSGGTHYQYTVRQGVEQIDGKWYTKYVLGPVFIDGDITAADQEAAYRANKDIEQAKAVRLDRAERLSQTDWTQVDDSPISNVVKSQWATYRQALRDIPTQTGFPWEVTWPTKP